MPLVTRTNPTRAQSDILRQSLIGVRQWLIREWRERVEDPPLTVVMANRYTPDKIIDLLENKDRNDPLPVPNVVIVPTMFGKGMDRYNSFALQHLGLHTGFINGRSAERREKVIPVDIGLGVRATCNDVWEVMMLGRIWAENLPNVKIRVYQDSTGFTFNATLQPDPGSLNIPHEEDSDTGLLRPDTTLILKTLSGTTEFNRLIRKTQTTIGSTPDAENVQAVYASTITDGYRRDKNRWPKPAGSA